MRRVAGWLLACAILAGCGGGGGGSGSDNGTNANGNSWLTFTPSAVTLESEPGVTRSITITAHSSRTISESLSVGIIDRAGVLNPGGSVVALSATDYQANLLLSTTLSPGTYTGQLEVRLCRDGDPTVCSNPYPGSPWQVPYQFTILGATSNLGTLRSLSGAGAWSTFQGNAAHTGVVSANVDPANFSRRFSWSGYVTNVAIEEGRVFAVSGGTLSAISESSGTVLWSAPLGTFSANPPAVAGGKVYVTSLDGAEDHLWIFDAATGTQLSRTTLTVQQSSFSQTGTLAPVVSNSKVYATGGLYGGLSRLDAATGLTDWTVTTPLYDQWTPAVDADQVYAYAGNRLEVVRVQDGSSVVSIDDAGFSSTTTAMYAAPVLSGSDVYVTQFSGTVTGRLLDFDVAGGALRWQVSGTFSSNPVISDGVLYVVNGAELEARSATTGARLWGWASPEGFGRSGQSGDIHSLVIVGRLIFVSTGASTHAVNIDTRRSVWSHSASGSLAVSSNGVLYIASTHSSSLIAINLH